MNESDSKTVEIRPARPSDIDLLLELIHELAVYEKAPEEAVATPELMHEALFGQKPTAEAVIAEWRGQPAGFALFFHNFSTWLGKPGLYLEDLFVPERFRGRGIGKALLLHLAGIARERDILAEVRARADAVIDTTDLSPHGLKAEIAERFAIATQGGLGVSVQSFSFKRGAPHDADMVLDVRFLRNPYWDTSLRALDGEEPAIQDFVAGDPLYPAFFEKLIDLVMMLLPAYRAEGKAHFSIALGCTGGRHRSVATAEALAERLASEGWPVTLRHRELGRRRAAGRRATTGWGA